MSSAKHIEAIGVLAAVESTYNTAATLSTASHGVQIIPPWPDVKQSYLFTGERYVQPGAYGRMQQVTPAGRWASGSIKCEAKGQGVAYNTASRTVPHIHNLLRASGFDATETMTTSAEKWLFTPTAATSSPASLTLGLYGRQQLYTVQGAYCNLKVSCQDGGIPVWQFDYQGTMPTDPSDVTLPNITYHTQTVLPPIASGVGLTLGNYLVGIIRSFDFDLGRAIAGPRRNINAAGGTVAAHAGFAPGERKPTLKVVLEATALAGTPFTSSSGMDPYNLFKNASSVACSLGVGSTQYNRWELLFPNGVQLDDVVDQADGPIATWELTLSPYASSPTSTDDVNVQFD